MQCRVAEARLVRANDNALVGSNGIVDASLADHSHSQRTTRLVVTSEYNRRARKKTEIACCFRIQLSRDGASGDWQGQLFLAQPSGRQNFFGPAALPDVKGQEA